MLRTWKLYRLVSPSGKVYLGQTVNDVALRWRKHCEAANRGDTHCHKLYAAIRKYQPENFLVQELFSVATKTEADIAERKLIQAHDSTRLGYNIAEGGGGYSKDACKRGHVGADRPASVCVVCRRQRALKYYYENRDSILEKRAADPAERKRHSEAQKRVRKKRKADPERYRAWLDRANLQRREKRAAARHQKIANV